MKTRRQQGPQIKVASVDYHRNGMCGAPFHVVLFHDPEVLHDEEPALMMATVFGDPGRVAVLMVDQLAEGDAAFGLNSWRGDRYEQQLRTAVREYEKRTAAEHDEATCPHDVGGPCTCISEPEDICHGCGETKPRSALQVNPLNPIGLWCSPCVADGPKVRQ